MPPSVSMESTALVGCTGLVGSRILTTLLSLGLPPAVHAIARRDLSCESPNLKPSIDPDSSHWPGIVKGLSPTPKVFLSALGTTRRQAGSYEAQRKIDYDLNLELAQAAKEAGVKVFVILSSSGTSEQSSIPYSKMKGELEVSVAKLDFPHTVILRPGFLVGTRTGGRTPENIMTSVVTGLGRISKPFFADWWAQDAEVVARAATAAAMVCIEGSRKEGVWKMDQSEIVRLGRTEWVST